MVAGNRLGFQLCQSSLDLFGSQFHCSLLNSVWVTPANMANPSEPVLFRHVLRHLRNRQRFDSELARESCSACVRRPSIRRGSAAEVAPQLSTLMPVSLITLP